MKSFIAKGVISILVNLKYFRFKLLKYKENNKKICNTFDHNFKNIPVYRVAQKNLEQAIFLGLCSDQQLSFFTSLDRASFLHYNNTKIIKFGWELFILWVISYGLSFSGFVINLSLIVPRNSGNRANPENDSP